MNIVILAGGFGTRLWPVSRSLRPKQFIELYDENTTLLQSTLNRIEGLDIESIYIICNHEHKFLVAEQVRQLNLNAKIIL